MARKEADQAPRIGTLIKQLRVSQGLTLDDLAGRSGISKSMLSQIERNATNPTIATVWRMATALGMRTEDLLRTRRDEPVIEVIPPHSIPSIASADRKCRLRILGPLSLAGRIEWYELEADPSGALISEAHEPGTVEHLSLFEGELLVESGTERRELAAGMTARYPGDVKHAIRNSGKKPARALLVVAMPVVSHRVS